MGVSDFTEIIIYIAVVVALAPPLGIFIAKALAGEKHFLTLPLGWLEHGIYKVSGVDRAFEMGWRRYAFSLVAFNDWAVPFSSPSPSAALPPPDNQSS